jgi:hypothetical protein
VTLVLSHKNNYLSPVIMVKPIFLIHTHPDNLLFYRDNILVCIQNVLYWPVLPMALCPLYRIKSKANDFLASLTIELDDDTSFLKDVRCPVKI